MRYPQYSILYNAKQKTQKLTKTNHTSIKSPTVEPARNGLKGILNKKNLVTNSKIALSDFVLNYIEFFKAYMHASFPDLVLF